MLRESINSKDGNFTLASITEGIDDDEDVPHSKLLAEFAEAVVNRSQERIGQLSQELTKCVGEDGFIDAAAVASGFHGVVRIADAAGIPVVNQMSEGVSSELNVDHFYASSLGDRGATA